MDVAERHDVRTVRGVFKNKNPKERTKKFLNNNERKLKLRTYDSSSSF